MTSSLYIIGNAVGSFADYNQDSMGTTADDVFTLILCGLPLSEAISAQQSRDQAKWVTDSFLSLTDPSKQPLVAADYSMLQIDEAAGDRQIGYQGTILQAEQSQLRTEGNAMDSIYTDAEPFMELQDWVSMMVLRYFKD